MSSTLTAEIEIFDQHRVEWMRSHRDQFVAIQGAEIADGFFQTYADALTAGLAKFGVGKPFLVKQISPSEPIYFVS